MLHSNVTKTVPDYHYVDNDDDIVHILKGVVSFFYWTKILSDSPEQLLLGTHLGNFSIYIVYNSENSTNQVKL